MKNLYAILGAPGTGKTTFINNVSHELFGDDRLRHYVVSPDNIRLQLQCPKQNPDGTHRISMDSEKVVWDFVWTIIDAKADKGEVIIVDATHSRNSALSAYKKYADKGYRVHLIDFRDIPLETVQSQNANRGELKYVPADRVSTMYYRIQAMDIPNWINIIKPEDFVEHFKDIVFDFSQYQHLDFFGDIHGCYDEFVKVLRSLGINPDEKDPDDNKGAYIFIGDYFDRGPKVVEMFRLLQKLQENKFTLFLKGNHEEPLEFMKEMYVNSTIAFNTWLDHVVASEDEYSPEFQKAMSQHRGASWKKLDEIIEQMKEYPEYFEKFSSFLHGFKLIPEFATLIKTSSRRTMRTFVLSDITYQEISMFYKRLAQLFYAKYGTETILATHGGLPSLPTRLTPTADLIRGVGGYDDAQLCDETFAKNHPTSLSIHGHRNTTNIPIQNTACTFNLNGDVDLGLRAVRINQDLSIETTEIDPEPETLLFDRERKIRSAKKFGAKKLTAEEESKGMVALFQDHKHVDLKELPEDIVAVNFTRKAFEKGIWDAITLKARGLFLDNRETVAQDDKRVIARGYLKFFNLGERHGIEKKDLRLLSYPVTAYEKANGYLGLLSVDTRGPEPKWFISSKSTTVGDFAVKFRDMITPLLTPELMQAMQDENITMVFEVIDPEWDPHIEEYNESQLVILDCIKNDLNFERLPFEALDVFKGLFKTPQEHQVNLRIKNLLGVFETFNELNIFLNNTNANPKLSATGIEGAVLEDSSETPVMFKLKTDWYSFWKYQRSMKSRIISSMRKSKDGILDKSILIKYRERFHVAEEIRVFEALLQICKEPGAEKLSVPELRKKVLEELKKVKEV